MVRSFNFFTAEADVSYYPQIFLTLWVVRMCDKMAISAYILKVVEKDPFLSLQMRAKEMFNRHQFFSTNKQYVKIQLMQNETNL